MNSGMYAENHDNLINDIIRLSQAEAPKKCKTFVAKEGLKLKNNIRAALKATFKKKTGNLIARKKLKRGSVFLYKPLNAYETRIHFAHHTHLLEYGFHHFKSGRHIAGRHIVGKTESAFTDVFESDVENLVDEITEEW